MPTYTFQHANFAAVNFCPTDLWEEHQRNLKLHHNGTASWRPEWEIKLYSPGDLRNGKRCETGGSFFRHIACGKEYKCNNMCGAAFVHDCSKVRHHLLVIFPTTTLP